MNNYYLTSVLAGVFFGLWPLLLNRSGFNGNFASVIFAGIGFIFILAVSILTGSMHSSSHPNWYMVVAAGIASASGVLLLNSVLAKVSPANVSTIFVLMLIVQISIPAIYQVIISGSLSFQKALGFILAAITAWLLLKA